MENILKCRALYLRSIALLFRTSLMVDDNFLEILDNFLENYYWSYKEMFDLIYVFEEDDDKNNKDNIEKDDLLLKKYLFDFTVNDSAIKLYEDIGIENVNKVSMLAELFYEYYCEVIDMKKIRVRS